MLALGKRVEEGLVRTPERCQTGRDSLDQMEGKKRLNCLKEVAIKSKKFVV